MGHRPAPNGIKEPCAVPRDLVRRKAAAGALLFTLLLMPGCSLSSTASTVLHQEHLFAKAHATAITSAAAMLDCSSAQLASALNSASNSNGEDAAADGTANSAASSAASAPTRPTLEQGTQAPSSNASGAENGGSGNAGGSDAPSANDPTSEDDNVFPKPWHSSQQDDFTLLTSEALGSTLAEGYRFYVDGTVILDGDITGTCGFTANNNVIYIPKGSSLIVYGARGNGTTGGKAAIELKDGKSLCITGEGQLICYGGSAGNGEDGGNGENGTHDDDADTYTGGAGGYGGAGGGGAGAAIGTNGGDGGARVNGGGSVTEDQDLGESNQSNGLPGESGSAGHAAEDAGYLYLAGTLSVRLHGGDSGTRGSGGSGGSADIVDHVYKYNAGGGGGGGAGGGGSAAPAFGNGGTGGSAGGGGGGGGCVWKARTSSDKNEAPMGGGGAGGTAGGTGEAAGVSGTAGGGTQHEVDKFIGGAGGGSNAPDALVNVDQESHFQALSTVKAECYNYRPYGSNTSSPTTVQDESAFASAVNNGAWYVENYLYYSGGSCGGATQLSFYTIIGSTRASDIEDLLTNEAYFPEKEGYIFLGYALSQDPSKLERVYNASTCAFRTWPLVHAGLLKNAEEGLFTWQGWTTTAIFAEWSKETYTIRYDANGGILWDTETKQLVGSYEDSSYDDGGYPCGEATYLWDNETRGACQVLPPLGSGKVFAGWTALLDQDGNAIGKVYSADSIYHGTDTANATVTLYAVWKDA